MSKQELTLAFLTALFFALSLLVSKLRERRYEKRKRALDEFDRECESLVRKKPTYPWPMVLRISEQQYIDREVRRYRQMRPKYNTLLKSKKALTIANWFSPEDQRSLFGIYPSPTPKNPSTNPKKLEHE